jgi:YfiH family protein
MIKIVSENGVVYYRSKLIPCTHGFSTRIGGVSEFKHTFALNLGIGRDDPNDIVLKNLELFSKALEIDPHSVISATQIHSAIVRIVGSEDCGEGYYFPTKEACDGYVSNQKGIALGIRTADCVPILLYAPKNDNSEEIISAVHAGWRGTNKNIVSCAIDRMVDMGAKTEDIKAAIGPSIGSCCYEVSKDFFDVFCDTLGKETAECFIRPSSENEGHFMADLKNINRYQLEACGIRNENIDVANICTCCDPKEFYSHRYSGEARGTMLSLICL